MTNPTKMMMKLAMDIPDELMEASVEAGARALFNATHPPGIDWWKDAEPSTKRVYRIKVMAVLAAVADTVLAAADEQEESS